MRKHFHHIPVLLSEAISALNIQKGGKYIDATIGGGGHGIEILKRGGIVLGIDQDSEAIENLKSKITESEFKIGKEMILVHGNFSQIRSIARKNGFEGASGVLFDLGMSSYQLEGSGRGFSFSRNEPLDMRMNPEALLTAADIVNTYSEDKLYEIFTKLGEERNSRAIIHSIISTRRQDPIKTSAALATIVRESVGPVGAIHPATKVFQALRMAVNNELANLKQGLVSAIDVVNRGGRIAVISFHSLEDRIVKNEFRKQESMQQGKLHTKKPIIATGEEVTRNPRARSAKLRVLEKQ